MWAAVTAFFSSMAIALWVESMPPGQAGRFEGYPDVFWGVTLFVGGAVLLAFVTVAVLCAAWAVFAAIRCVLGPMPWGGVYSPEAGRSVALAFGRTRKTRDGQRSMSIVIDGVRAGTMTQDCGNGAAGGSEWRTSGEHSLLEDACLGTDMGDAMRSVEQMIKRRLSLEEGEPAAP